MKHIITTSMLALSTSVAFIVAAPAFPHHSSAPHFDHDTTQTVTGTFTELKFVNPHAYIYFDVKTDGKTEGWRCELSSATQLKRWGWSADMFRPGQEMTITGNPAWREDNVCLFRSAIMTDGTEVARNTNYRSDEMEPGDDLWEGRAKTLANGQPNLSGPWQTLSFGRNAEYGDEYAAVHNQAGKDAAIGYEMEFDNPIIRCHFVNIVNGWIHDENVNDIMQTHEVVTLQYGFMDLVRTIHLNLDSHPDDLKPSSAGHSIGRWEGDTLVVETTGFLAGILEHRYGHMHSDQVSVTERFHVDYDEKLLVRNYVINDPLYLEQPAIGHDGQKLVDTPYEPYACVELSGANNIRPGESYVLPEGANPAEVVDAASPENLVKPADSQSKAQLAAPEKSGLSRLWSLVIGGAIGLIAIMLLRRKS